MNDKKSKKSLWLVGTLWRKLRYFVLSALVVVVFGLCVALALDFYVGSFAKGSLYYVVEDIPYRRAAIVLGTAQYVDGRKNLYYEYRLNAAARLWEAGKVDAIVVSGDNSRKDYDEPSSMKEGLVNRGVPGEYVTVDYAGFRTLDSIVRAQEVFGLDDYIVVSQKFHCERAIYLAEKKGHDVIGYCALDVSGAAGKKGRLREVLARTKAVLDIISRRGPKYLGNKEKINYRIRS